MPDTSCVYEHVPLTDIYPTYLFNFVMNNLYLVFKIVDENCSKHTSIVYILRIVYVFDRLFGRQKTLLLNLTGPVHLEVLLVCSSPSRGQVPNCAPIITI